ncbi:MAG TPA: conjugal transfer protein MobC [Chitinophagaceae bacterium]|nr:conjugal transfer protein MobC [Chitinophagaceae bacterium]
MQTGENIQGLHRILDMTRMFSMILLLLHFYYYCHAAFRRWHLTGPLADKLMLGIARTGLFSHFYRSEIIILVVLVISLIGAQGKKEEKPRYRSICLGILTGLLFYFFSAVFLYLPLSAEQSAILYMAVNSLGFLLFLAGATRLSRILKMDPEPDIFNRLNETFPQQEQLVVNPWSVNLPAKYRLKDQWRNSWINIINPFRGLLVLGTPGSGKSFFIIREVIRQHIRKGFSMLVYDFKYDDLSRIAYREYLAGGQYPVPPSFRVIHFDDLARTSRCNPLDPGNMKDVTDAAEAARTILLGLNQDWIRRQGDFFVESPIHFVTALIWFLCRYRNGQFCTLPHVVELAQMPYDKLFTVLRTEPQAEVLVHPFITAYLNEAREQLEGQIASATISLARLSSPNLYYVLSGNEFTLDIGNPRQPKIVCMGNNPQKSGVYGSVISLYITSLTRLLNRKGNLKSSLVFDEFPTIYLHGIDNLIATARSNQVAATLAIQDLSQLKLHYGRDLADVILNITGNIIAGQVSGETARHLSERFGRILQDRQSISIHDSDTSISHSRFLEPALPASRIASLSTGEFVGMVADDLENPIDQKVFHGLITRQDTGEEKLPELPVVRQWDPQTVQAAYLQIKEDIRELVDSEMQRILDTPALTQLVIKK